MFENPIRSAWQNAICNRALLTLFAALFLINLSIPIAIVVRFGLSTFGQYSLLCAIGSFVALFMDAGGRTQIERSFASLTGRARYIHYLIVFPTVLLAFVVTNAISVRLQEFLPLIFATFMFEVFFELNLANRRANGQLLSDARMRILRKAALLVGIFLVSAENASLMELILIHLGSNVFLTVFTLPQTSSRTNKPKPREKVSSSKQLFIGKLYIFVTGLTVFLYQKLPYAYAEVFKTPFETFGMIVLVYKLHEAASFFATPIGNLILQRMKETVKLSNADLTGKKSLTNI